MTKNKSKPILLLATGMLWAGIAQAQESANASGGDATGSGGTVAYSVGQVVYTTHTGSTGTVAQGVQQPYEISVVLGIENSLIDLDITAYPNPTTHFLTLNIGNALSETLHFQLCDLGGKIIERRKITNRTETINMENLATATYLLKVSNANNEVKIFKIIKN